MDNKLQRSKRVERISRVILLTLLPVDDSVAALATLINVSARVIVAVEGINSEAEATQSSEDLFVKQVRKMCAFYRARTPK